VHGAERECELGELLAVLVSRRLVALIRGCGGLPATPSQCPVDEAEREECHEAGEQIEIRRALPGADWR